MVSTPGVSQPQVAILTGPTASGKTSLAFELIESHPRSQDIEIINADSLLIYRQMDIGTAKPTPAERAKHAHHLIDIRDPDEPFTAGDFKRATEAALLDIESRGKRALIVGGTGFYLKALIYGLWSAPESDPEILKKLEAQTNETLFKKLEQRDPVSALRIGVNDRYRLLRAVTLIHMTGKSPTELEIEQKDREPNPRFALWIIDRKSEELFARIEERTRTMIASGIVEESQALLGKYPGARSLDAVGYREAVAFLKKIPPSGRKLKPGLPGLAEEITLATRQLVKKQRTWFRGQARSAIHFELDRERSRVVQAWRAIYG
jgi:tRNA dimethylallyltransferase